ncbi:MAG: restriction endonuclease subunit S, partial [Bacteroidales bacterium]|nr:restriction endonuclease subunit S [Bacteroidales bacterium]
MEISFPISLAEQQRIVDILDREFAKIDVLKANAEKSLQAAKDLFQATLKKELEPREGWKKYCLKDVCTDYGDYGMSLPSKAYESIRYLRITDITEWGELNNDRVSVDTDVIDDRYMLKEGDVLFARTGATVGKTLVYEDAFGDCCYAGYLIRYRPNQNIVLPRMLYFITHSASYYEWVATNQKSATLPNISAKLYNVFELTLPSIKEQKEIVSRLDDLANKSKALNGNYQKTLTLCDDLKQSILRKAFNGEL